MRFFKMLIIGVLGFFGLVIASGILLATYLFFTSPLIKISIKNRTGQAVNQINIDCNGENITSSVKMPIYMKDKDNKLIKLVTYDRGSGYFCQSEITLESKKIIQNKFGGFGLFPKKYHTIVLKK